MPEGICVNENLIFDLTSRYAREYNDLPNTNRQAIQYAYEQGIKDFAEWYNNHEHYKGFPYEIGSGSEQKFMTMLSPEGVVREYFNTNKY